MPECPVCRTQYTDNPVKYCNCCGWDLADYPATIGTIPEIYLEKDNFKLTWARHLWSKLELKQKQSQELDFRNQQKLEQLQSFLEEEKKQECQLQIQIEQL